MANAVARASKDRPEPSRSPGQPEQESWRGRRSPSPIPIALLLLCLTALGSACQAVVMEPMDEASSYRSSIRFWGYSPSPGEPIAIEAQNSSSAWEVMTSTTSALVPTHTAGATGYFFEAWYYGPSIPTRFRKTSPFASQGYWRTNFRINTSGTLGALRMYQPNGTNSTSPNWFEEFWLEHKASSTTLRIDVHP
jgi:hypothetical protein